MITQTLDLYLQIVTTYIIPSIALCIMLALAIKKLQQTRDNPYNIVISLFFFGLILGLLMNAVYGILVGTDEPLAFFFARLSAMFFDFTNIFPLFFLIALEKSFKSISRRFKILYFMSLSLLALPVLFVGNVFLSGTFVLCWDPVLAAYSLLYALSIFIAIMFYSFKLMKSFENSQIKRRFIFFIVGYWIIILMLLAVVLVKLQLATPIISSVFMLLGIFAAPLLIYYGVTKKK